MKQSFLVSAAQVAPAYLDLEGSLSIAEKWIANAGKKNISMIIFSENNNI